MSAKIAKGETQRATAEDAKDAEDAEAEHKSAGIWLERIAWYQVRSGRYHAL